MDPAVLEEWMMTGLVSILFILFFVLGLGVAAFVIKSVVIGLIESGTL
jgi:hypothetical protein